MTPGAVLATGQEDGATAEARTWLIESATRRGTHRRVTFKDLLLFERKRDKTRRETLDKLASEVEAAGLYNSNYAGEP